MILSELRIADVWAQLVGPELKLNGRPRVYGRAFWRSGKNLRSVALNPHMNAFHDWPSGAKGGILRLVQTVHGSNEHDALTWLETYCGLTPTRPLSPIEEQRRRAAEKEAQALLQWRNEMLEALRCRRNRNWKLYHQAKNWILKYSLGNMRGCLLAEVCDLCEEEALRTDEKIEKLREQDWDTWLRLYRSRYQ